MKDGDGEEFRFAVSHAVADDEGNGVLPKVIVGHWDFNHGPMPTGQEIEDAVNFPRVVEWPGGRFCGSGNQGHRLGRGVDAVAVGLGNGRSNGPDLNVHAALGDFVVFGIHVVPKTEVDRNGDRNSTIDAGEVKIEEALMGRTGGQGRQGTRLLRVHVAQDIGDDHGHGRARDGGVALVFDHGGHGVVPVVIRRTWVLRVVGRHEAHHDQIGRVVKPEVNAVDVVGRDQISAGIEDAKLKEVTAGLIVGEDWEVPAELGQPTPVVSCQVNLGVRRCHRCATKVVRQAPSPCHVEVTATAEVDVVVDPPSFALPRVGDVRVQHCTVVVAGHVKEAITRILVLRDHDVLEFLRHDHHHGQFIVAGVEVGFDEGEGHGVIRLSGPCRPVRGGGRPCRGERVGVTLQRRQAWNRARALFAVRVPAWGTLGARFPFDVTGRAAATRILVGHLNFQRNLIEGIDVLRLEGADGAGQAKVTGGRRSDGQRHHERREEKPDEKQRTPTRQPVCIHV